MIIYTIVLFCIIIVLQIFNGKEITIESMLMGLLAGGLIPIALALVLNVFIPEATFKAILRPGVLCTLGLILLLFAIQTLKKCIINA